jgi:hypothetical protein
MSKNKVARKSDDDVTEIFEIDPSRIDAVGQAATRLPFLLLKSVAPERDKTAAKRALRARKAAVRASAKRAARAALKAAEAMPNYSNPEIPATGIPGEAASILASVSGERTSGLCSAKTASGGMCQRPAATSGGACHHHA